MQPSCMEWKSGKNCLKQEKTRKIQGKDLTRIFNQPITPYIGLITETGV